MERTSTLLLLTAIAASVSLVGCMADESLPSRPRTATPYLDKNAEQNAEQRVLEAPPRPGPAAVQDLKSSSAPVDNAVDPRVLTLQAGAGTSAAAGEAPTQVTEAVPVESSTPPSSEWFRGPSGLQKWGHTFGPTTVYNRQIYPGPLPLLPVNPGTAPLVGSTPAPSGDWAIDHSWGQGLVLENYPHRPWPKTTAEYKAEPVSHNPTYYYNIQEHKRMESTVGTFSGDWVSSITEVPWFYLNTVSLPVLMLLEPPLALRVSERASYDPNFRGHLPGGPVVPAPFPAELQWTYPFLNPDGTVKQSPTGRGAMTEPATAPATMPATPRTP